MKKIKRKSYKERGITLVALVITIIILLILAGVTLTTALSNNGLFIRTKEATEKYKGSEEQEKESIDDIIDEYDSIISSDAGTNVTTPTEKDWNKDKVDAVTDEEGNIIPVPKDFYYAGGSKTTGFVISDEKDDDLNNSKKRKSICMDTMYRGSI